MNILIRCFVEFTRGVPQLVQISIIYFALPYIGIYFDEFWTGVVALSFIGAGYTIEIFVTQFSILKKDNMRQVKF